MTQGSDVITAGRAIFTKFKALGVNSVFAEFGDWAEACGIPPFSWWPTHFAIDTDQPHHIGGKAEPWLENADALSALFDAMAQVLNAKSITLNWVRKRLGEVLWGKFSTVHSELNVKLGSIERRGHNSLFQEPHFGRLGWGFPAALGHTCPSRASWSSP